MNFSLTYNTMIVLAGTSLLGASAGLVGSLAVLRRRALIGDALAHATLPGICLAFLILQQRSLPGLLLGAFLSGIAGVGVIAALQRGTRIKEDAAIGIVLSVFFGAGIVLSRIVQNRASQGSKAGLDSYILGKTAGMIAQDVYLIGGVALIALILILMLHKELKLVIFDPGFARAQGWPVHKVDLLLMGLVAAIVVIGLPAVGVVLVAAMLILPGTAARFWTGTLGNLLFLSVVIGLLTGAIGTIVSSQFEVLPAGPIIVLVGSAFFLVSLLFAPRKGLLSQLRENAQLKRELDERNILRLLFDRSEASLPQIPFIEESDILKIKTWTPSRLHAIEQSMLKQGYVERNGSPRIRLTQHGLERAIQISRGHRLWEMFLADQAEGANAVADLSLESVETVLPPPMVELLTQKLRDEGRWPEGIISSARGSKV